MTNLQKTHKEKAECTPTIETDASRARNGQQGAPQDQKLKSSLTQFKHRSYPRAFYQLYRRHTMYNNSIYSGLCLYAVCNNIHMHTMPYILLHALRHSWISVSFKLLPFQRDAIEIFVILLYIKNFSSLTV